MKHKKILLLVFGISFCCLAAYAATNSSADVKDGYNSAHSSSTENNVVESTISETISEMNLITDKVTNLDTTPFNEDMFLSLTMTEDYEEILSLEKDMLAKGQYLYEMGKIECPIDSEDIDYEKAVKIFMDGEYSITELSTITKSNLQDYLDKREYIWELPINVGSQTISFTFNIGKPFDNSLADLLTEEQQEEIKANEGHWMIARTAWNDSKIDDYKKYVNNILEKNQFEKLKTSSVLIGGIPNVYQPVAIVLADDAVYVMPSCEASAYAIATLVNNDKSEMERTYSRMDIFSYADFKKLVDYK